MNSFPKTRYQLNISKETTSRFVTENSFPKNLVSNSFPKNLVSARFRISFPVMFLKTNEIEFPRSNLVSGSNPLFINEISFPNFTPLLRRGGSRELPPYVDGWGGARARKEKKR